MFCFVFSDVIETQKQVIQCHHCLLTILVIGHVMLQQFPDLIGICVKFPFSLLNIVESRFCSFSVYSYLNSYQNWVSSLEIVSLKGSYYLYFYKIKMPKLRRTLPSRSVRIGSAALVVYLLEAVLAHLIKCPYLFKVFTK